MLERRVAGNASNHVFRYGVTTGSSLGPDDGAGINLRNALTEGLGSCISPDSAKVITLRIYNSTLGH